LKLRRLSVSDDELSPLLSRAKENYFAEKNRLYLCAAQPCCGQSRFEAGGRFIALRMDASYPLADGRKDVHKALVIVGSEPSSGSITAHAYTDGGLVRQYLVERFEQSLQFADEPPGHRECWKRARKILRPTIEGFEERLEVDDGSGHVPYYVIPMQRVNDVAPTGGVTVFGAA
jgi:hypothetical protein